MNKTKFVEIIHVLPSVFEFVMLTGWVLGLTQPQYKFVAQTTLVTGLPGVLVTSLISVIIALGCLRNRKSKIALAINTIPIILFVGFAWWIIYSFDKAFSHFTF
jgi:hypothetical protein